MHVVNSPGTFTQMLEYLQENGEVLFLDMEGNGLDPYTSDFFLLSIRGGEETFVIDFVALGIGYLKKMRALLESPRVKVLHNAVFDYKHIYHNSGIKLNNIHCTMITDQLLNAGLYFEFGLEEVAERRLKVKLDKTVRARFIDRDTTVPFTQEELEYSAKDSEVLEGIYNQQVKELTQKNMWRVYNTECALIPIVSMMEYQGVCIDTVRLKSALPVTRQLLADLEAALQDDIINFGASDEIVINGDGYIAANTGSPKQMLGVLNYIGVDVKSLSNKELSDWDSQWSKKHSKEILEQEDDEDGIAIGFNHPFLRKLAIRTAVAKIQGTYIEGLNNRINPVTGRIHPGFKQCGAVSTGRMSSVNPNFQNLPNMRKLSALGLQSCDIRSMFVPAEGCDFIICDYSGIELVILAVMSGDKKLLHELLQGDIHAYVANSLEGDKILRAHRELVTPINKKVKGGPWETIRNEFKRVSYGIAYGSTGYNMYRTLYMPLASVGINITQKDADRWVEDWKSILFPETGKLLNKNSEYAVTRGYTESVLGRRRHWLVMEIRQEKWKTFAAMREGMNHPIQASSADMTKLAMVLLDPKLDKRYARIVAAVHDELLVESQKSYTDTAAQLTKQCMEDAGYILFPTAVKGLIQAEPKISDRYDK